MNAARVKSTTRAAVRRSVKRPRKTDRHIANAGRARIFAFVGGYRRRVDEFWKRAAARIMAARRRS
jgi:hypothetical protein